MKAGGVQSPQGPELFPERAEQWGSTTVGTPNPSNSSTRQGQQTPSAQCSPSQARPARMGRQRLLRRAAVFGVWLRGAHAGGRASGRDSLARPLMVLKAGWAVETSIWNMTISAIQQGMTNCMRPVPGQNSV